MITIILSFNSDLSVTQYSCVLELAPYRIAAAGCQGFKGPFPSAFLDKQ